MIVLCTFNNVQHDRHAEGRCELTEPPADTLTAKSCRLVDWNVWLEFSRIQWDEGTFQRTEHLTFELCLCTAVWMLLLYYTLRVEILCCSVMWMVVCLTCRLAERTRRRDHGTVVSDWRASVQPTVRRSQQTCSFSTGTEQCIGHEELDKQQISHR